VRALGIDVGGPKKGLDVVVLDEDLTILGSHAHLAVEGLEAIIRTVEPAVIAIDSPPRPALHGNARRAERHLAKIGIHSYATPSDPERFDHPFYGWMRVGFAAFEAAGACGYHRYASGRVRGDAIEVFPHASVVALTGCLPPTGVPKGRWRRRVLESRGVSNVALRSIDQIDAALAALTGQMALQGESCAFGDPDEGVIVLPIRMTAIAEPAYRRCPTDEPDRRQIPLPGMSRCACGDPGCDRLTNREFAPGHDGKRKSILWRRARSGEDALNELQTRGWQLPPEMRKRT
jgi:predicted nuclease with RNAse H fold